ncbi:MAG: phosphate ABC transporter permease subunit PstC, partial [Rhodanobacter sp.]
MNANATLDVLEQRSRRDARHERLFRWLLKGCALIVLAALIGA